jgi:hypothetical protein
MAHAVEPRVSRAMHRSPPHVGRVDVHGQNQER